MIRKEFGNIRLNDHNIRAFCIFLCIFPLNAFAEIIFFKHVSIFLHFLHIDFTLTPYAEDHKSSKTKYRQKL